MRRTLYTLFFVFFFTCESPKGPVESEIQDGLQGDTAETDALDTTADESEYDISDTLKEVEIDAPITCESILAPMQCIDHNKCPAGMKCSGIVECPEEDCWGVCDMIPGVCSFVTDGKICKDDSDCGAKSVCVFTSTCVTEDVCVKASKKGICLPKPDNKYCFEDDDCWGGLICGGEYICLGEKFCLGRNHPGKCLVAHRAGKCWDDLDCQTGEYCKGASICLSGECAGKDLPGVCESLNKNPVSCADKTECGDFKECIGAYKCKSPEGCAFNDSEGFCGAPPGLNGCWSDYDCAMDEVCSGAIICPPTYPCSEGNVPGTCVKFSTPAVTVKTSKSKYDGNEEVLVSIVNASGHLIFMPGCHFFTLEEWIGSEFMDTGPVFQCEGKHFIRTIPDGWGAVAVIKLEKKGKFRLNFLGAVGCQQGVYDSNPECMVNFEVKSEEFTVGI